MVGITGSFTIPRDFPKGVVDESAPRVALVEHSRDVFVASAMVGSVTAMIAGYSQPAVKTARISGQPRLDVVEVYPYVPYIQYLLPGSTVMSIFMMVMIGGGIFFIDEKARGLHAGDIVSRR